MIEACKTILPSCLTIQFGCDSEAMFQSVFVCRAASIPQLYVPSQPPKRTPYPYPPIPWLSRATPMTNSALLGGWQSAPEYATWNRHFILASCGSSSQSSHISRTVQREGHQPSHRVKSSKPHATTARRCC